MSEEKKPEGSLQTQDPPAEKKTKSPEEHLDLAKKNQEKLDAEHPRFKEVYAKMKDHERALSERDKDIEAMREHVQKMERQVAEIKEKKADKALPEEPDPIVDPEGYKAWNKLRRAEDEKKSAQREYERELHLAIGIVSSQHDDYDDVIKVAQKEMSKDAELRGKIWADPVMAPGRAYKLGKKIMDEKQKAADAEKDRKERLEKDELLKDGGEGGGEDEVKLTEAEKRVVRNLYPDMAFKDAEKRYIASKKSLGGN